MPCLELFPAVVNAVSEVSPHPLPEVAPAQLIDQLASLVPAANALEHGITHFGEAQDPVTDVWRQSGDCAFEVIAAFGVTTRIDKAQCFLRSVPASAQWAEPPAGFRKLFCQQTVEF